MPDPASIHPSLKSGLTGGAATGRGVDYQTLYAVYVALKLIVRLLRDSPQHRPLLLIEPRILSDDTLTRWDLQVSPDGIAVEAKSNATKDDLIELLKRARKSVESTQGQRFEFVYDECSVGYLKALMKLVRLAEESAGDELRFAKLCELEVEGNLNHVLGTLGDSAFGVGQRLTLKHFPFHLMEDEINLHLQFLVSSAQAVHLRDGLYSRFVAAMSKRKTFFIPELMQRFEDEGIEFVDSGTVIPKNMDPILHKAIFLLQQCVVGLPLEVVAAVCNESESVLSALLKTSQVVANDDNGLCKVSPFPTAIDHIDAAVILGNGLRATLQFIRNNKSNEAGFLQVENAIAIAKKCATENPAAATTVFGPLDKLLKRRGRKREVLEIARITVESARRVSPPTEDVRRAEAKALICGFSWVFQRIGQLADAEAKGEESLKLGESIDWPRNTAYCLKCLGRLRRVCAEQHQNPKSKIKMLGESRDLLQRAIKAFSECNEFGPTHPEVGDCYSLLARTYFLAKRSHDADLCAVEARKLITAEPGYQSSKDYMDLMILEGELHTDRFEYQQSEDKLTAALACLDPDNAEKSEIAARAHLTRGTNFLKWKNDKEAASREFERAVQIWDRLNEHFYKGVAKWRILEMMEEVPKRYRNKLKKVVPSVRVEAARLFKAYRQQKNSKTLSQRAELTDSAWDRLIAEAKKNDAIRHIHW